MQYTGPNFDQYYGLVKEFHPGDEYNEWENTYDCETSEKDRSEWAEHYLKKAKRPALDHALFNARMGGKKKQLADEFIATYDPNLPGPKKKKPAPGEESPKGPLARMRAEIKDMHNGYYINISKDHYFDHEDNLIMLLAVGPHNKDIVAFVYNPNWKGDDLIDQAEEVHEEKTIFENLRAADQDHLADNLWAAGYYRE